MHKISLIRSTIKVEHNSFAMFMTLFGKLAKIYAIPVFLYAKCSSIHISKELAFRLVLGSYPICLILRKTYAYWVKRLLTSNNKIISISANSYLMDLWHLHKNLRLLNWRCPATDFSCKFEPTGLFLIEVIALGGPHCCKLGIRNTTSLD